MFFFFLLFLVWVLYQYTRYSCQIRSDPFPLIHWNWLIGLDSSTRWEKTASEVVSNFAMVHWTQLGHANIDTEKARVVSVMREIEARSTEVLTVSWIKMKCFLDYYDVSWIKLQRLDEVHVHFIRRSFGSVSCPFPSASLPTSNWHKLSQLILSFFLFLLLY